ncbi:hypothetical protein [Paenibacillus sp. UASWS1643]|uniref:hypothetical protein n=1 Tax=Paenibacillus sp. UASWS1643 TaxID=2580422 RepID=UPI0016861A68|nr:hypothetical protein [Paenibacillus sp. UASWS1643]
MKRTDWRFIKRLGKDGKLSRKTKKRLKTSGRVMRQQLDEIMRTPYPVIEMDWRNY